MGKNKNVYLRIGLICIGLGLLGLTSVLMHWAIFGLRGSFIPNYELTGMIEFVPGFERLLHGLFVIIKSILVLGLFVVGMGMIFRSDAAKRWAPHIMLLGVIFETASLCRVLFNQIRFMDMQQELVSQVFSVIPDQTPFSASFMTYIQYWVPGFILYTLIWQGMKIAFFERSRRALSQRSGEEAQAESGA